MTEYSIIETTLTVVPAGDPIYSEKATTISIADEAAGCFIEISQVGRSAEDDGRQTIAFDPEEWPAIARAVERTIATIREMEGEGEK